SGGDGCRIATARSISGKDGWRGGGDVHRGERKGAERAAHHNSRRARFERGWKCEVDLRRRDKEERRQDAVDRYSCSRELCRQRQCLRHFGADGEIAAESAGNRVGRKRASAIVCGIDG